MKHNLVTKANALIEASYRLTVAEQKIILLLASKVQPEDEDFKEYTFAIVDFMSLLGIKNKGKYKEVQETTKKLMQKTFEFRTGNILTQIAWLSGAQYHEGEGKVTLVFHRWLRPFLLQLKKEFTRYRLENVIQLRSVYSIRIYELLKQYEGLKYREFEIDTLRQMLGLTETEYRLYADLKRRIIIIAQKELAQKTDISFEFEEIKVGRGKVKAIKFLIKKNKEIFKDNKSPKDNINNNTIDQKKMENTKNESTVFKELSIYLDKKTALEFINTYGEKDCNKQLKKISKKINSIPNPGGWLRTALERENLKKQKDLEKVTKEGFIVNIDENILQDSFSECNNSYNEILSPDGEKLLKRIEKIKK
jgi:plasmid replication initiation protein